VLSTSSLLVEVEEVIRGLEVLVDIEQVQGFL
jgi:hypothetical protein